MNSRLALISALLFLVPVASGVGASMEPGPPERLIDMRADERFAGDQTGFFTVWWRRPFVLQALERSGRYVPLILGVLQKERLPSELVYLPLVESEYDPWAVSRAGAAGLWQFMPETARILGLKVSGDVDERLDPVKSTRAAARFLRDLHALFGNWPEALAAYNCGPGVLRAVRLKKRMEFPEETRLYVPRFMAAVRVGLNPPAYGYAPRYDPAMVDVDSLAIKNSWNAIRTAS